MRGRPKSLYIIAGEASGDILGARLLEGLKSLEPELRFRGVGGGEMAAQGMPSLFAMDELSVMGLAEVLPRLPGLLRRIRETADDVIQTRPDALITVDSPDFCLRVARRVRAQLPDLKTIHYVAPTVWAWRPERAAKMAEVIDHVLALFPFEPPYMEAEGMSCDFVGHPVAAAPIPNPEAIAKARAAIGLSSDQPYLLVLPGSRRGEVTRLQTIFADAIAGFADRFQIVIPAAPAVYDQLKTDLSHWPRATTLVPPDLVSRHKGALFAGATAALAASGTVSLELAAARTPMVIAYNFNWLTTRLVRKKVILDTVTLVNILTGTHAVPEYLLENCTAENIRAGLDALLSNPAKAAEQIEVQDRALKLLGRDKPDVGLLAAESVLNFLAKDGGTAV